MPTNAAPVDKQQKPTAGAGNGKKRAAKQPVKPPMIDLNLQLLEAVRQEKPRVVKRLLDTRANVNVTNERGESVIMLACANPSQETRSRLVPLILSYGCDVNLQDNGGKTALMRTVEAGDTENTRALLDHKAKVGLVDYEGDTALLYSARLGNSELMRWMVKEYRRARLDIDHKNMRGVTALLLACQGGHLEAARILVEEGRASLTIRDLDNFMTAEEWMKQSSFHSVADMEFLSSRTNRRARRNLKAVKTLDEYMKESDLLPATGPNLGNVYHFNAETDPFRGRVGALPMLAPASGSDAKAATARVSRSMFDLPGLGSSATSSKPKSFAMGKPVPLQRQSVLSSDPLLPSRRNKYDLYHSTYLLKRQSFVRPNRQSKYFAEGSLEPIQQASMRSQLKRMNSLEERTHADLSRKSFFPPIDDLRKS